MPRVSGNLFLFLWSKVHKMIEQSFVDLKDLIFFYIWLLSFRLVLRADFQLRHVTSHKKNNNNIWINGKKRRQESAVSDIRKDEMNVKRIEQILSLVCHPSQIYRYISIYLYILRYVRIHMYIEDLVRALTMLW